MKISRNTVLFENPPTLYSYAAIAGEKEGKGPLAEYFDEVCADSYFGQKTWEKAESELLRRTAERALDKGGLKSSDIDYAFAGDLQNQCCSTTYGLRDMDIPLFCVYGACSTISESLALAAMMTDAGFGGKLMAATSSHFCSAERQFRYPLAYGGVRTPTAQWTCTAAGAAIVSENERPPYIKGVSVGKIVDMGVTDTSNMGAAMAPAAAYIIKNYLTDTGLYPEDFDAIVTGDLGRVGGTLLTELLSKDGIDISRQYKDCGTMIYNISSQDVHAGGSGCGCSASVLCGYFLDKVKNGELRDILFCATGALMSATLSSQGESIPSISHAVHISHDGTRLEKRGV